MVSDGAWSNQNILLRKERIQRVCKSNKHIKITNSSWDRPKPRTAVTHTCSKTEMANICINMCIHLDVLPIIIPFIYFPFRRSVFFFSSWCWVIAASLFSRGGCGDVIRRAPSSWPAVRKRGSGACWCKLGDGSHRVVIYNSYSHMHTLPLTPTTCSLTRPPIHSYCAVYPPLE